LVDGLKNSAVGVDTLGFFEVLDHPPIRTTSPEAGNAAGSAESKSTSAVAASATLFWAVADVSGVNFSGGSHAGSSAIASSARINRSPAGRSIPPFYLKIIFQLMRQSMVI